MTYAEALAYIAIHEGAVLAMADPRSDAMVEAYTIHAARPGDPRARADFIATVEDFERRYGNHPPPRP